MEQGSLAFIVFSFISYGSSTVSLSVFLPNLEILLNFVQEPYFTDETVEKEKGIIEQEIMMYEDDPSWRLYMNSYLAAFHNHPIRIPIAGTKESIADIDKETLYNCYNAFYAPNISV